MKLNLFIIGLISILGQVVLLRELAVAFYGIELIYILAMGFWLFWTAVGALIGRRSFIPKPAWISFLLILFSLALPLDIAFVRAIRIVFNGTPGAFLPFHHQILGMALALLPCGIILGLLFQWAARSFISIPSDISSKWVHSLPLAYGIECLGAVAGGLLSTFALTLGLQNFEIALLCGCISLGSVIWVSLSTLKSWQSWRLIQFVLLGVMIALAFRSDEIDLLMTKWNYEGMGGSSVSQSENQLEVISTKDSPYGRITVVSQYDQIAVFENGALSFETEGVAAEEFVYLASLQHPALQNVLLLGGGISGYVEMLKSSVGVEAPNLRVRYIELDAVLLNIAQNLLPDNIRTSLTSEKVNITIADPRRFLAETEELYDLILIGMPEPSTGQSNRYYTVEFFERCSKSLNPDGIVALKLRSSENLWTPQLRKRNESIHNALRTVFVSVVTLPGAVNMMFGSNTQLETTPTVLTERYRNRDLAGRLIIPEYIEYLYTNERFFRISEYLAKSTVSANSDLRPVSYQYAIMLWLAKFFPSYALWNTAFSDPSRYNLYLFLAIIGLAIFFFLLRKSVPIKRVMLVAVAGFAGIVIETILLLYFQVERGILYQDIGLLLMIFMAGMTLGSLFIAYGIRNASHEAFHTKRFGFVILCGFALLSCIIGLTMMNLNPNIWLICGAGLCFSGFGVGAIFAYASVFKVEDQSAVISRLYAADLFGGCVGVVFASLMFIPIVGFVGTSFFISAVLLLSVLLI